MKVFKSIWVLELHEIGCSERCVLLSLEQMNSFANPTPFFPLLLKFLSQILNLMLFDFVSNCHMRSKLLMLLADKLRKLGCNFLIDLLELVPINCWINKADSMREARHLFEC